MQLIDERNGTHLRAQSYQHTLNDIFGVEGEVAAKIAQQNTRPHFDFQPLK